jgi:hypothetical protein
MLLEASPEHIPLPVIKRTRKAEATMAGKGDLVNGFNRYLLGRYKDVLVQNHFAGMNKIFRIKTKTICRLNPKLFFLISPL